MTPDVEAILIAVVFALQVGVLSFFTPYRRRRDYEFVVTSYPPTEYPRLYTVPKEAMDRRFALFGPMRLAVGVASIAVLTAGLLYARTPAQYGLWMICCLMAQILPTYLQTPWMLKTASRRRAMPPPSVRSVELRQWRIVDFVSPVRIMLGFTLQTVAMSCAVLVYRHQPRTLPLTVVCAAISTTLLLRMGYVLRGAVPLARTDPYMAEEDTFRTRKRRFALLFGGGAAFAILEVFMMLYSAHLLSFDYGYICAGLSIIFQLLALALVSAQSRDLRTLNFSVYRVESGAQAAR
jgi:hypothetical protein